MNAYESSPTKRHRRTKAAMEDIRKAIEGVLAEESPATVRQVFYRLVVSSAIDKSEAGYKTVCRLLAEMRREGRVPYSAIADNTRWMRKPDTWSSLEDALESTQATYRRALWDEQDVYVEIWLEKDALAGVLLGITSKWDVPLMVSRGFASLSFLHSAAETIREVDKPAHLYYFGDHDPSGVIIDRKIEETLREMAPDAEIHFKRVAVLEHQIKTLGLPTRPTKKKGTHAKTFTGDSVEVDAIAPSELRQMAEFCIARHIDLKTYRRTRRAEMAERDTLAEMVARGLQ